MEKRPFFRAAMAGLGKYHMGGYGRIGVYRDLTTHSTSSSMLNLTSEILEAYPLYFIKQLCK